MKISFQHSTFLITLLCCAAMTAKAQFTFSGQLRTRTEFRNGVGTLRPLTYDPAFFTSQRTRLNAGYTGNKVTFFAALQDVRVWGQDASSISNADGNKLGVHEAWAEIMLANKKDTAFKKNAVDYFGIKIGRQELMYDDSRLLGNLDWLQQARRHDAVVFKFLNKGFQVDLGAAFNQNTDAFSYNGTYYVPANVNPYVKDSKGNLVATPAGIIPIVSASGNSAKSGTLSVQNAPSTNAQNQQYKALQFLYAAKSFGKSKLTLLAVADHFGKYRIDSVKNISGTDTGYVYGRRYNRAGVNSRFTTGLLLNSMLDKKGKLALTAGAYYQGGKDKEALSVSAFTTTLALAYTQKKFSYTLGWDYLSGNDAFSTSTTNHRFDPLYGTPHKFWGFMDYFYVGTGAPTGGLSNGFAKVKYTSANKRFTSGLDYHYFALANDQKDASGKAISKYLGSEFDWVSTYAVNKITTFELGVCYIATTTSMSYAKNLTPATSQPNGSWAYLQVNIKPTFFTK